MIIQYRITERVQKDLAFSGKDAAVFQAADIPDSQVSDLADNQYLTVNKDGHLSIDMLIYYKSSYHEFDYVISGPDDLRRALVTFSSIMADKKEDLARTEKQAIESDLRNRALLVTEKAEAKRLAVETSHAREVLAEELSRIPDLEAQVESLKSSLLEKDSALAENNFDLIEWDDLEWTDSFAEIDDLPLDTQKVIRDSEINFSRFEKWTKRLDGDDMSTKGIYIGGIGSSHFNIGEFDLTY